MESDAPWPAAGMLSPQAGEAVRRVREALGKEEQSMAPMLRHIAARVIPSLLRAGADLGNCPRISRKVVAVGEEICIKLTGSAKELDLLTGLHCADPAHTVRPLFAVLGPDLKMAGYGMERMQTTANEMALSLGSKRMLRLLPEIDRQSLEAVASYGAAGLEHGDITVYNAGMSIGQDGSVSLKFMDPLPACRARGEAVPDAQGGRDDSKMRIGMLMELRATAHEAQNE